MIRTLLSLLLYCSLCAAEGEIPSPEDVAVISRDLGLILTWNPPRNSTGQNFTYTAEYKGYVSFKTMCWNISSLSCDFTGNVSVFGVYNLRVRTELEGRSSDWIVMENVYLDMMTVISAPDVKLESRKGEIEVSITGPALRKRRLEDYFHPVSYRIQYWIEGEEEKDEQKADHKMVMLQSLTPNVRYCVQVEILLRGGATTSLPSNDTCILNTENDDVELWLIVVVLLGSCAVVLVSVVLVFFACWYSYRGFRFLHPKAKLPEHFKQYLCEHPKSTLFLAMQNSADPEERYHEVSIVQCLDDSSAPQEVHQAEDPNRMAGQNRTGTLCERERRPDGENTGRTVSQSDDGEMELLLQ